ncbi:hypothetical protein CPT_Mangalyan_163 [Escherichia phage Mangalyan]|nr:hypothetical protein CPT_Mangalyan_163 [Escherichia phage Mangalyan]
MLGAPITHLSTKFSTTTITYLPHMTVCLFSEQSCLDILAYPDKIKFFSFLLPSNSGFLFSSV